MREIKFRAWQIHYKEMYNHPFGYLEFYKDNNVVGFDDGDLRLEGDDVILMQYTGLKDKHGVEIYEGDCFGFPRVGKESEFVGTVYFDIDLGAFCVNQTNGGFQYLGKWLLDNRTCEVVGNIYENPELLKEIKTQI